MLERNLSLLIIVKKYNYCFIGRGLNLVQGVRSFLDYYM